MRLSAAVGIGALVSLAGMSAAFAAPVELVCKYNGSEAHLTIDLDAATVIWGGQSFHADVNDTQVHWAGIFPVGRGTNGPDIDATLDRDTGTLVVSQEAGSDPDSGIRWGSAHNTWACTKAQKIL